MNALDTYKEIESNILRGLDDTIGSDEYLEEIEEKLSTVNSDILIKFINSAVYLGYTTSVLFSLVWEDLKRRGINPSKLDNIFYSPNSAVIKGLPTLTLL